MAWVNICFLNLSAAYLDNNVSALLERQSCYMQNRQIDEILHPV